MTPEDTGKIIRQLRTEKNLTQKEFADMIFVSDKAVSKWERGEGTPDITSVSRISEILGIPAETLLSGKIKTTEISGANIRNTRFFICPSCKNVVIQTGDAKISCCGKTLTALKKIPAAEADKEHLPHLTEDEDEICLASGHSMTKENHLAFAAALSDSTLHIQRLYPEQEAFSRIKKINGGHKMRIMAGCTCGLAVEIETE
ncbi:helix-turn-helix domain-containing protein [Treponema sp.]|uniref:helix-turn-helix domain-containing protein n=1 Tax=Treponema sp. TaxID=166 RepID=UPI003EFC9F38